MGKYSFVEFLQLIDNSDVILFDLIHFGLISYFLRLLFFTIKIPRKSNTIRLHRVCVINIIVNSDVILFISSTGSFFLFTSILLKKLV